MAISGALLQGGGQNIAVAAPVQSVQKAGGLKAVNTGKFPVSASPAARPSPAVDPYSGTVFGSTAGFNKASSDYNSLKDSTLSSIGDAINQGGQGYHSSILDYLDSRKQQQSQINSDATQNELAREQGMQGILDMVGNGIKSGGVQLANANAGTSSAGEALARAYGITGRQQASSVGNQFAQGQNKIDTEQTNLTTADAQQKRHTQEQKVNTINSIVNSARSQLASLNQSAAYASLPDRVNIEAKIAELKQNAMNALSAFDKELSGGISSNTPQSADQIRANANKLLTAGTAPDTSFDYTTNAPAQFQNTGQFASSLPIFTTPRNRQQ